MGYQRFARLFDLYSKSQILPYDEAASEAFDSLRDQKVRIGTMDLRIASIALTRNMTVLTRNLTDFRKVPGLRAEDWTA